MRTPRKEYSLVKHSLNCNDSESSSTANSSGVDDDDGVSAENSEVTKLIPNAQLHDSGQSNGQDDKKSDSGLKNSDIDIFDDSFSAELMSNLNMWNKLEEHANPNQGTPGAVAPQEVKNGDGSTNESPFQQKHSTPLQNGLGQNPDNNGNYNIDMEGSFFSNNEEGSSRVANGSMNDMLMESITSQMDTSLQIFEDEVEVADAANQFESEDLFPPDQDNNSLLIKIAASESGQNDSDSSSDDDVLNESPSSHGQIIKTPQSSQKRKNISGNTPTHRISEESSDQFDSGFLSHQTPSNQYKEANINGTIIKIKVVDTPEFIPLEKLKPNQRVGIGMNLSAPKRIRSLSRSGIGSRIVAARTISHSVQRSTRFGNNAKDNKQNAVTIFDEAGGIIWIYQWTQKSADRLNSDVAVKVAQIFRRIRNAKATIAMIDAKEKLKKLFKFCGKMFNMSDISLMKSTIVMDPKLAEWLMQSEDQIIKLEDMCSAYLSNGEREVKKLGWSTELVESYWALKLMGILQRKLETVNLWGHFKDVEMPCILPLVLMEINGFGLNSIELEKLKKCLDFKCALLELRAYHLAGRQFNLSSPKEIRDILFREIGLKEPEQRGTAKDVLVKLNHELPQIIVEWRKVMNAIKMVIHFLQDKNLDTGRVHGCYSHFTVSGRVVMSEPSLQCIPRDFDLKLSYSTEQIEITRDTCRVKFGSKLGILLAKIEQGIDMSDLSICDARKINISMRNAFVPCSDTYTIMSADYSQLELRILAHLCGDTNLIKVLNESGKDVFKCIAAEWKDIDLDEVTVEMRQEAKAITYGIIYGMGSKALAEHMDVDQDEASNYIAEFMRAYPKIRSFIDKTVKDCRKNGYVETISGRKRLLENINSKNTGERAQAERQAINFRIQGSASELVKTAMNRIFTNLATLYPDTINPIEWKNRIKNNRSTPHAHVWFPILNLHDELIFEVMETHLVDIAREIKFVMETALKLKVCLPVVVKTGKTWGTLLPYVTTQ